MARFYERDYRDYEIEIGDRIEFEHDGQKLKGTVDGRGAAGNYLKVLGDDGRLYDAYSSDPDVHKIFPEDE